ncbi:PilZ domain-containing protein [Phycisphaeraceae bacterium D3-23]
MQDRRQKPRFSTLGLTTPFGQVTNISDAGLCIFRKGKLELAVGQTVNLVVQHEQAEASLKGIVIRIEPLGLFRHEIGVEFTAVDVNELGGIRRLIELAHAESVSPSCYLAA